MKEIILLGKLQNTTFMNYLTRSPKFKINTLDEIDTADRVINKKNPDFVLCSGRIRIDEEGNYYLEI